MKYHLCVEKKPNIRNTQSWISTPNFKSNRIRNWCFEYINAKSKGVAKEQIFEKVNSAKRNAITKGIKDYTWFFEVFCKPLQRDSLFSESLLSYVPDIISTYEGCWDNLSNFSQFNKVKNSIVWRVALLVFQFDAVFGILNSKWLCDLELECAVL